MIQSIRARLTVWYTLALAVALILFSAATYALLQGQLRRASDDALRSTTAQVRNALIDEVDESRGVLVPRSVAEILRGLTQSDQPGFVFAEGGRELASAESQAMTAEDREALRQHLQQRKTGLMRLRPESPFRLVLMNVRIAGRPYSIAMLRPMTSDNEILVQARRAMMLAIPVALLVAAMGGWLLARKSLAPVAAMSAQARAISAENLGDRIDISNPRDELGELGLTLNGLLERLDGAFASQRRFMADASHELRTPVAILQGELDVALSRDQRDAADYRESLEIMSKSVRKLTRIVRDLFLLVRTDAGELPLRQERFYLDETLSQTVQSLRTLAAERGVRLVEKHDRELIIRGDEDLVQRLIVNLVENAIKYTASGGMVNVRTTATDRSVCIEVQDSGTGVPAGLHEKIFERFVRADPTRGASQQAGTNGSGAGLGLPIARWIAEAHGGRIWLERSDPSGSLFRAILPREADLNHPG